MATSILLDGASTSSLASRSRTTSEADSLSSSTTSSSVACQQQILPSNNHGAPLSATSCRVFLYSLDTYETIELAERDTAESVCHRLLSERLKFKPVVELLFGLRNSQDNCFVPACRRLVAKSQYELRVRFKMPDNTKLKALDKNAFEYYYMQVRHDLIRCKYPGINYEAENDKILGLVVADMYLEMIKYNTSVEDLSKQYKRFTPKPNQRFAKRKFKDILRNIQRKDYDQYYIMESYLSQLNTIGPYYLREEYAGETNYAAGEELASSTSMTSVAHSSSSAQSTRELVPRRNLLPLIHPKSTSCALKIELCPEYRKEPVLKIHFKHTDSIRIYPIKGITVIVMLDEKSVHVEWSEHVDRTTLDFTVSSAALAESLVSGLATYNRLMDRWTFDLCGTLTTPSLVRLSELRCHGPIGFPAAYEKLQPLGVGYYLVRLCDQVHDTYNLDIKTSHNKVRTFKVTRGGTDEWYLHRLEHPNNPQRFYSLNDIARSIRLPEAAHPIRIGPPSQAGELPSLLLCQKQSETRKVLTTGDVVGGEPKCINPKQLVLKRETHRVMEGSALSEVLADWTIDNKTFVEVTLKALKPNQIETNMMAFMNQAQKWCSLQSRDILRIYGITLYNPTAMVMERTQCTLSQLLLNHRPHTRLLIDVTQSLARAINQMHSLNMVHSMIRCSTIHVVTWNEDRLVVRLGDPGINNTFTEADQPWIPVEYHGQGRLKMSKLDLKTDIWAYCTTLWQIFSSGRKPNKDCFSRSENAVLPKPHECPDKLYAIMRKGWDRDPEKRFEPQSLFTWLYHIRQEFEHYYQPMAPRAVAVARSGNSNVNSGNSNVNSSHRNGDSTSLGSLASAETEQIDLSEGGGTPLIHTGTSNTGTSFSGSESSVTLGYLNSNSTQATHNIMSPLLVDDLSLSPSSYLERMPSVLETTTYRVVLQGVLGNGHYGTVFNGELWYTDDESTKVAVKMLKTTTATINDLQDESRIMKAVDHPNIVKIIDFHCEVDVAIIMEYMPNGNLGAYLTAQRFYVTDAMRLRFARDIAAGMEYLQLKDIVHRDLAVRNVLVAEDNTLKISDFGLARKLGPEGYYLLQDPDKGLPIHYWAPETLGYSLYSIKSDVWSYGITLFEIFKRDEEKPILVEGTVDDLIAALELGRRLPRSDTCPEAVYDQLMRPCWEYEKERRPNFTLILRAVDGLISEMGEAV